MIMRGTREEKNANHVCDALYRRRKNRHIPFDGARKQDVTQMTLQLKNTLVDNHVCVVIIILFSFSSITKTVLCCSFMIISCYLLCV